MILTLPDPEAGFRRLARLLHPGAPIFIWMYSRGRGRQIACVETLRAVSTHLPYRFLNALCVVFAALHWALWIAPYKLLSRFPLTRPLARRIPFTYHAAFPFRVLHTDWFDGLSTPLHSYYRREEVARWYEQAGLERITMDPAWGQNGGGRGLWYAIG